MPFRFAIQEDRRTQHGMLVNPGEYYYELMKDLTIKVICVMRTPRAKQALSHLATFWLHHHHLYGDSDHLATSFQRFLGEASQDLSKWPLTVMDWALEGGQDAYFQMSLSPSRSPTRGAGHPFHKNFIHVNGLVSLQLLSSKFQAVC